MRLAGASLKLFIVGSLVAITTFSHAVPMEGLEPLDPKAEIKSTKDYQLVVFWATWCKDCKEHLRGSFKNLLSNDKVDLLTVNVEKDRDRVKTFLADEKMSYPVLFDPESKLRKSLKIFSVPAWAVYRKIEGQYVLIDSASAFEEERVQKALGGMKI